MTAVDVDRLAELEAAATPGPWTAEGAPNGFAPMVVGDGMAVAETFDKPNLDDAQFIAAMRNALPALLAEVAAGREASVERDEAVLRADRMQQANREHIDRIEPIKGDPIPVQGQISAGEMFCIEWPDMDRWYTAARDMVRPSGSGYYPHFRAAPPACSQCGREWAAPACGMGHAMKAHELGITSRTFEEDEALSAAPSEAPTPPAEEVCAECGATDDECMETDGGCCASCRATAGCSHPSETRSTGEEPHRSPNVPVSGPEFVEGQQVTVTYTRNQHGEWRRRSDMPGDYGLMDASIRYLLDSGDASLVGGPEQAVDVEAWESAYLRRFGNTTSTKLEEIFEWLAAAGVAVPDGA